MTFKNKKFTTIALTSMIIGLLTMLPLTIMPNVNAQPTAAEQLKAQIEPQPTANGCYHWTKETGWKTITCISPEELKKQPADIPTEGGNVYPGVVGGHSSSNPYWGEVETKFSQYSGETDTYYNSANTWSIQLNTNTWYTPDNHQHWAQFVEQNHPGGNLRNCIWQFDLTLGTNSKSCVSVPQQTLNSTFDGFVTGYVISSSQLRGTYCNVNTSGCWSVVGTNSYNLGSYWTDTSGTILGEGNSATAKFTSPTSETTYVQAQSESSASTFNSYDTGEWNNLNYNTGTSTSCSSGTCTTTSSSYN